MILMHLKFYAPKNIFFFIVFSSILQAYEPVKMLNNEKEELSIMSPFDQFLRVDNTGNIYVAASDQSAVDQLEGFSFALLQPEANALSPLITKNIPKKAEEGEETPNPLYQKGIKHIAVIGKNDVVGMQSYVEAPIVVTCQEPNVLYLFESNRPEQRSSLMKSMPAKDAFDHDAGEIVALETGGGYVFAAVSPKEGIFGDPGSAIVVFLRGFVKVPDSQDKTKEKTVMTFVQMAAIQFDASKIPMHRGSTVALKWDDQVSRLFIVIKSPDDIGLGLRSVFVGRLENPNKESKKEIQNRRAQEFKDKRKKELEYKKEEEALKEIERISGSKIVRKTQDQPVEKNAKKETMPSFFIEPFVDLKILKEYYDQFGVKNLFISGAIKDVSVLRTSSLLSYLVLTFKLQEDKGLYCCAFPITANKIEGEKGCLANKREKPTDVYRNWPKGKASFGSRIIGKKACAIDEFTMTEDATCFIGRAPFPNPVLQMFVRSEAVYVVTEHAIYSSQALLDEWSRIKGWSCWRKQFEVEGPAKIIKADLNQKNGTYILMIENEQGVCQIVKTSWAQDFLNDLHKKDTGVVTAMCVKDQACTFIAHDTAIIEYDVAQKIVLQTISHTYEKILALTYTQNKLFIGTKEALFEYDFDQKKFSFVAALKNSKKLFVDHEFLYVVTNESIHRVKKENDTEYKSVLLFSSGSSQNVFGKISDVLISGPLALIATTKGLFSNQEGTSVRKASGQNDLKWVHVPIPEGLLPVAKLVPITYDGTMNGLTKNEGGYLYVVTSYQGKDQGRLNRFSVNPLSDVVLKDTLVPFHDYYLKDTPSHFLDFCSMISGFFFDGAHYFFVSDFVGKVPSIWALSDRFDPSIGFRFKGARRSVVLTLKDHKDHIFDVLSIPGKGLVVCTNKGFYFNN